MTQEIYRSLSIILLLFVSLGNLFAAEMLPSTEANFSSEQNEAYDNDPFDLLSSNWLEEAKAALPSSDFANGNPDFLQMTNLLCQEAQRGNNAALGLWGMALVVQKDPSGMQVLQQSAQNGYVPAMYNLGVLYEAGKYVPKDYDQAFHWFGLAATNGNSEALFHLGRCYHYGMGTPPNSAMAAQCYHLAAEETNYVAMKSYGYFLINGIGVEKDLDAAKYWLSRAAKEGGNRRAMYNLGVLCAMKFPDPNAMAEAFQWFKQSAELGDPLASFYLANCYYNGWGVETNLDRYRRWRLQAAILGATEAQYEMGAACATGNGVPKDVDLSLAWYQKAAAKNHPIALYDLAVYYVADKSNPESSRMAGDYMLRAAQAGELEAQFRCAMYYFVGDDLPKECDAGKQWLATAAQNGWAEAEFTLFSWYFNGFAPVPSCTPYPKDQMEALKWLRRAVKHGNLQAESTMAIMLIQGTCMDKNMPEAEKLLRDAARHGYASAQNDLGYAILQGDVGSGDLVEAAMWCQLAKSHWPTPATFHRPEANLINISSRLTPDQELEVQHRVDNFQPLPVVQPLPLVQDWDKNPRYQQED